MKCKCDVCRRNLRVRRVCEHGDVDEMRRLIGELQESLAHTELDYQVDEAILAGTWPSARMHLTSGLARCAAHEALAKCAAAHEATERAKQLPRHACSNAQGLPNTCAVCADFEHQNGNH